jgi:hypothetical protein
MDSNSDSELYLNYSGDEPPRFPRLSNPIHVYLSSEEFRQIISRVVFAMPKAKSNPAPFGIHVELAEKVLSFMTYDEVNFSTMTTEVSTSRNWSGFIPYRSIRKWYELSTQVRQIALVFDRNRVVFVADAVELWVEANEWRLPSGAKLLELVEEFLQDARPNVLTVPFHIWRDRLKLILSLSEPYESRLNLWMQGDRLVMEVDKAKEARNEWKGVSWVGEEMQITICGWRLLEWLESLPGMGMVRLEIGVDGERKTVLGRRVSDRDKGRWMMEAYGESE